MIPGRPARGEVQPCLQRIRTWRIPPHYSFRDWMDEMQAHCTAAALEAECRFDPAYGVALPTFVRQRVLASALARYRQEWNYALRCTSGVDADILPSVFRDEFSRVVLRDWLEVGLKRLSARDQWVVKRLYSDLCTEAEVACELSVTQQAVSKHKDVILRHLRDLLTESPSGQKRYPRAVNAG